MTTTASPCPTPPRLAYALKGDVKKGLFFRGSEPLPFGTAIRPVADLLQYLLTGAAPQAA